MDAFGVNSSMLKLFLKKYNMKGEAKSKSTEHTALSKIKVQKLCKKEPVASAPDYNSYGLCTGAFIGKISKRRGQKKEVKQKQAVKQMKSVKQKKAVKQSDAPLASVISSCPSKIRHPRPMLSDRSTVVSVT